MARNKRAAQDTETAASAAKKSKKDENKVEVMIATRFLIDKVHHPFHSLNQACRAVELDKILEYNLDLKKEDVYCQINLIKSKLLK